MTNIIADVAGQYKALVELVNMMPEGETISLGDMVDRGPDSVRVLEFFMQEGRRAVLGNHEHMMISEYRRSGFYQKDLWLVNGGYQTLQDYISRKPNIQPSGDVLHAYINADHITWLENLPKYIELPGGVLLSHAFLSNPLGIDEREHLEWASDPGYSMYDKAKRLIFWNRNPPKPLKTWKLQVAGHNAYMGVKRFVDSDNNTVGLCLDGSKKRILTGLHLETMTVYQVPYKHYPKPVSFSVKDLPTEIVHGNAFIEV